MNFLPKELEDIIVDYKTSIENYEKKCEKMVELCKVFKLDDHEMTEDEKHFRESDQEIIEVKITEKHNKDSILFFILLKEYLKKNKVYYSPTDLLSYGFPGQVCDIIKDKVRATEVYYLDKVTKIEFDDWEVAMVCGLVPGDFSAQEVFAGCCGPEMAEEAFLDVLYQGVFDFEFDEADY